MKLTQDDLAMMINEASKAKSDRTQQGVDQETYLSIMEHCTLF